MILWDIQYSGWPLELQDDLHDSKMTSRITSLAVMALGWHPWRQADDDIHCSSQDDLKYSEMTYIVPQDNIHHCRMTYRYCSRMTSTAPGWPLWLREGLDVTMMTLTAPGWHPPLLDDIHIARMASTAGGWPPLLRYNLCCSMYCMINSVEKGWLKIFMCFLRFLFMIFVSYIIINPFANNCEVCQ